MAITSTSQKAPTHAQQPTAQTASAPSVRIPKVLVAPSDGHDEVRPQAPKSSTQKLTEGLQTPEASEASKSSQGTRANKAPALPGDADITFEEVHGGGGNQRVQESLGKLFDRVG